MAANNLLIIAAASFLLLGCAAAAATRESEIFHVTGKVLCQECGEGYNEWVNGGSPINGSKVSVTCLDDRGKAIHFASDTTDDKGEFDICCKRRVAGSKKPINPQNCYLRLIKSGDAVCNIPTDFAGGKRGLKLRRPNVVYRDLIKYALGAFYYTTPMCDEPDTDDNDKRAKY